jgi:hypothetical protein
MVNRTVLRAALRGALAAALTVSLGLGQAAPAFAQSEMERGGAREAAKDGAKAFGEKRWADAIDLFTRAESLVHAPPHLLYIGRSAANLGQLVKARETYLKITREKLDAGAPQPFKDAQAAATKELASIEPRVPFVKIVVQPTGAKDLKVTVDDKDIPPALVGVSMPTDPGDHRLRATAEGMASDEVKLSLKEAAKESVTLTLKPAAGAPPIAAAPLPAPAPLLAPAGATAPPPPGAPVAGAPPAAPTPPPPATTAVAPDKGGGGGGGLRSAAYITGGIGLLGIGLGVVEMTSAKSKDSDAGNLYDQCNPHCTADQQQAVKDLESKRDSASALSVVGFVAGGAALATGFVLFLVSGGSDKAPPAKAASVSPFIGVGTAGVVGRF